MDEISQVKNRFRLEQWTQLIKDCQSSGMTVKAWCELNGVKQHSYYYWLRKIRKVACDQLPAVLTQTECSKPTEFAELKVSPSSYTHGSIIIHLPYASVEVAEGTSKETIEVVLMALKNSC